MALSSYGLVIKYIHLPFSHVLPINPGGQMHSPVSSWQTPLFMHVVQGRLQSGPHFWVSHPFVKKNMETECKAWTTQQTVIEQLIHDSHFSGQWGMKRKYSLWTLKDNSVIGGERVKQKMMIEAETRSTKSCLANRKGIKEGFPREWDANWMCRTTKATRRMRLKNVSQSEALWGRRFGVFMAWSETKAFLIQIHSISTTEEPDKNPNLRPRTLEWKTFVPGSCSQQACTLTLHGVGKGGLRPRRRNSQLHTLFQLESIWKTSEAKYQDRQNSAQCGKSFLDLSLLLPIFRLLIWLKNNFKYTEKLRSTLWLKI